MQPHLALENIQYDASHTHIRFGEMNYFSYLCIVKVNVYIYESNK